MGARDDARKVEGFPSEPRATGCVSRNIAEITPSDSPDV